MPDRAAIVAARAFGTMPFAGIGSSDATGLTFIPDPEKWIYAVILAAPVLPTYPGYSWKEQYPAPGGTWIDPPTNEGLSGDNGSVSTIPQNVAFEGTGLTDVAPGTIVKLYRGYQHGDAETGAPGQEYLFWAGGEGGSGGFDDCAANDTVCFDPITGIDHQTPCLTFYSLNFLPDTGTCCIQVTTISVVTDQATGLNVFCINAGDCTPPSDMGIPTE